MSAFVLAALCVTWPHHVHAQSSAGGLMGTVRDPSAAAIAAARVAVVGEHLVGGERVLPVDAEGRYRLFDLPPGAYTLTASSAGFSSVRRDGVVLPSGGAIVIDFELPVSPVADTIEVVAPSPMVDVTSPAASQNIPASLLRDLPTNRFVPGLINLVPGVLNEVAYGGSRLGNAMAADGVDMTEGGAQDPWLRLDQNWLQEVQVTSLGAGASEGGFTGLSANYVLRSGANRWSALGEVRFTRPDWVGKNTGSLATSQQATFAPRRIDQAWDVSAQAGFPVMRDRLWLFTGYQHSVLDDRPAGYTGDLWARRDDTLFMAKATSAPADGVRLEGFVQAGRYVAAGSNLSSQTLDTALGDLHRPQVSGNLRLTWAVGANTLLDARYSGSDLPAEFLSHPPNTCDGPAAHIDYQTGKQSGNVFTGCTRVANTRNNVEVSISHYAAAFAGRHDFKAGVQFERSDRWLDQRFPAGIVYQDFGGAPSQATLWEGYSLTTDVGQFSAYVEDRWQVGSRLTLTPGLRVDAGDGSLPEGDGAFSATVWSPRLGAAFEVTADHRTVIRAHYGRYYDPVFTTTLANADFSDLPPQVYVRVLAPGQFVEIGRVTYAENFHVDPAIRNSYVDQFVVGAERQLWANTSVLAQYLHRRFDDFMAVTDTASKWEAVSRTDPGPDGVAGTGDDGGAITAYNLLNPGQASYLYTNPQDARRKYDAVQFVARQRDTKYGQAQVSYTWSRTEGNVGNQAHVNAGLNEIGYGGIFTDPNRLINAYGRSAFDPTHEFKVLGTGRLPVWGGFNASVVYRYASGGTWAREVAVRGLTQGQARVRVEPRGTRRLEAPNVLDLRLEQAWRIGAAGRLGVYADVFNVTNQGVMTFPFPVSGPSFGTPNAWSDPRVVYAGLRYTF